MKAFSCQYGEVPNGLQFVNKLCQYSFIEDVTIRAENKQQN
jgi:hypothetical protein